MNQFFGSRLGAIILLGVIASFAITTSVSADKSEQPPIPDGTPVAPALPNDGTRYDLHYKLAIGDILRYEVTHRASIQSTIEQTTQAAQTKTDSIKGWKVTDVLPSGEIEFMNVVERVAMVNQLPERDPVEYDSERDKTPPPGFEDAAKAVGVPLSVVRITPQGKVTRRDIKLHQLHADDDAPIVVRLPDEPIAIGGMWDEPFEVKVELQNGTPGAPGGTTKQIQTRRHYRLADVTGDIAKIEVTYQVLSPIEPPQEAQLVQRMMNGVVQFNIATGRVEGQQMNIDKRILAFAGPTSSMQYIMRMEEKLLDPPKKLAEKPATPSTKSTATAPNSNPTNQGKSSTAKTADKAAGDSPNQAATTPNSSTRPVRTSSRPRPQSPRGSIR